MKIILNKRYGGFGASNKAYGFNVSDKAYELYAKKKGVSLYRYYINYNNKTMHKGSGFMTYYFTKDFDNGIRVDEIDWETQLCLNSEHRNDPTLIEVVEELGEKANGSYSKLKVVEIPDGMDYVINDYDGFETLHEKVKVW